MMGRIKVEFTVTRQLVSANLEGEIAGITKKLHDPNPHLRSSKALDQRHELVFLEITLPYCSVVAGTEWRCSFECN